MSAASSGPIRSLPSRWCWFRSICRSPTVSAPPPTACTPSSPQPGSKYCSMTATPAPASSSPTRSSSAFRTGWWWRSAASRQAGSSTATGATARAPSSRPARRSASYGRAWRKAMRLPGAGVAAPLSLGGACAPPNQQRDPALRDVVAHAIAEAQCFTSQYDSAVWYTLMEPRLRSIVKDQSERLEILKQVYCETHRTSEARLPPGLVMALIAIESRFDRWAVSATGAVGLMQVMPFWPEKLGMRRYELVRVAP